MRSTKYKSFSSLWSKNNILINVEKNFMSNYFLSMFFSTWYKKTLTTQESIVVNFKNQIHSRTVIDKNFFSYKRDIDTDGVIYTQIIKIKWVRALLRSLYKFVYKNSSVVGIPELFLSIFRTSIIEPLEYHAVKNGWILSHAAAIKDNNKTIMIAAGSKNGKSTVLNNLLSCSSAKALSDNYVLFNGKAVRTIDEPFRAGKASFFKLNFYGRTINGSPEIFDSFLTDLIILERGSKNMLTKISCKEAYGKIKNINISEKEGINHLDSDDLLFSSYIPEIKINSDINCYKLEIAEGEKNITNACANIRGIINE